MPSQERRFKGFNQEEWVVLMDALTSLYRQEIGVTQRAESLGMAHSEHWLKILDALIKELNEVGFWPKEEQA